MPTPSAGESGAFILCDFTMPGQAQAAAADRVVSLVFSSGAFWAEALCAEVFSAASAGLTADFEAQSPAEDSQGFSVELRGSAPSAALDWEQLSVELRDSAA